MTTRDTIKVTLLPIVYICSKDANLTEEEEHKFLKKLSSCMCNCKLIYVTDIKT